MWALCSQPFANNLLLQNFNLRFRLKSLLFQTQVKMVSSGADRPLDPPTNPKVTKLQELVNESSADGWEKSWEQRLTPWDLEQPTPVILHLLQTGSLPKGRALIPGCGSGYDVVAIASPECYVVGLDIADNAIKKAREEGNVLLRADCIIFICSPARGAQLDAFLLAGVGYMISSSAPNADYFTFLKADFFTWQPRDLFDLIFDYTFFCAIEPGLRPSWARCVRDLLKPEGELITLMFPISDHKGGPPYKVSLADYEEVLHPMGFEAISVIVNELAVGPRKGREKLGRWKRSLKQSLM